MSNAGYMPMDSAGRHGPMPVDPENKAFLGGVLGVNVNGESQPISPEGIVDLTFVMEETEAAATQAVASAADAQTARQAAESARAAAQDAQQSAERSATASQTAQGLAEDAQSAASRSANQAAASATAAAGSAAAAISSASDASASATQANNAKIAAEAAQAIAETAIQGVEDEGTRQVGLVEASGALERATLSGYVDQAATSAENAAASETAASGSATSAAASAASATQSATSAAAFVGSPLTASLASEMTDTTKVYVYTGAEVGLTAGHWYYYDGSGWADGGVYNAVATDDTLSVAGAAADAKAVGDTLSELNGIVEEQMCETIYDKDIWSQGGFDQMTGAFKMATTTIRTAAYLGPDVVRVTAPSPYLLYLFAYDSSDNYVGLWTGTEFSLVGYDEGYSTTSFDVFQMRLAYPTYKFRIAVKDGQGRYVFVKNLYPLVGIKRIKPSLSAAELTSLNMLFMSCAYTSEPTPYNTFKQTFLPVTDANIGALNAYIYNSSNVMTYESCTDAMTTPAYNIDNTTARPCTLAGILPYSFTPTSGRNPVMYIFKEGVRKDYFGEFNRWLQPADGTLAEYRYDISGNNNTDLQCVFSMDKNYVDDSYMYVVESGKVLFAGKNTPYYGLSNINGTVRG